MNNSCAPSLSDLNFSADQVTRLTSYAPATLDDDTWGACKGQVWTLVAAARPSNPKAAENLASALGHLMAVAEYTDGPVTRLLTEDRLAATLAHLDRRGLSTASVANVRGRLNRLVKAHISPESFDTKAPQQTPHAPYTAQEVQTLLAAASHPLAPPAYLTLLGVALGTGVVIPETYGADIDNGSVTVDDQAVQWVGPWAHLRHTATGPVDEKDWRAAAIFADSQPELPTLCRHRLRRTWLVGLLTSPISLHALIEAHRAGPRELASASLHLPQADRAECERLRDAASAADRRTSQGSPDLLEESMSRKRTSAAAARRARAALQNATPDPLPPAHAELLERYEPRARVIRAHWPTIRPVVHSIMQASQVDGFGSFKDQLSTVTKLAAWAADQDLPVSLPDLMRHELIERFIAAGGAGTAANTVATRRWRLRTLASKVNPGPDAPTGSPAISRASVRAPYTPLEVATIVRIATTQPNPRLSRQLCACVGLGLGAGLDASDLTDLRRRDITEDADGLTVTVRGARARSIPVCRDMEDLVRAGVQGLRDGALVVGTTTSRKKATHKVYEQAEALGDPPEMLQSRMRTTWLARLVVSPIPVSTVLAAAGLASTRTLTEILKHVTPPADMDVLRAVRR